MSWNEAARFINWLNTSTGNPPAYKFAIQPGEPNYVANTNIELWTNSDAGYDPNNLYRNTLAKYFLPSIDEWYKAAYYDPTTGIYYDFPTGSNTPPTAVASGTTTGTAVWGGHSSPADITLAGGLSPYGTMGQGGNAWERQETDVDLVNGPSSNSRAARAGSWGDITSNYMRASDLNAGGTTSESSHYGFRVASVDAATLAGDFNQDGDVDGRDFLLWQRDTNVGSLADWQANYGVPLLAAVSIPESTSLALLCLGALQDDCKVVNSMLPGA